MDADADEREAAVCAFIRYLHRRANPVGAMEQSLLDTISETCDKAGRLPNQTIPEFIRDLDGKAKAWKGEDAPTTEYDVSVKSKASSWELVCNLCEHLGMPKDQGAIAFIRDLHGRAGEERYTTWQIIMYLESKIIKSFDGSWNPRNEYLREAINHIHNPQDGIKAVTGRNEKESKA
jgi:hypothetical protein